MPKGIKCCVCKREYFIGDYPYCPHETIDTSQSDPRRHFRFDNYVDEHIDRQPVEVTSPGHRDALMKQNALEVRDREHINDLNHRRHKLGLPPLPR